MSTPFSDIYIKANLLFDDAPLLGDLTDDEYSELLELFLNKSRSIYFKSCKKDLSDIDDTLKQFNEDLDDEEQWILSHGMLLVWYSRKLYREENLRDKLTTKDYNASHSTGNLIDKLTMLKKETEKELKNLINSYSFNEFEGFD